MFSFFVSVEQVTILVHESKQPTALEETVPSSDMLLGEKQRQEDISEGEPAAGRKP